MLKNEKRYLFPNKPDHTWLKIIPSISLQAYKVPNILLLANRWKLYKITKNTQKKLLDSALLISAFAFFI